MPAPVRTPLVGLTIALNEVADALASADLPRLLAAEPAVCAALDGLAGFAHSDRDAVERARAALLRCRRLGAGLVAFTRVSLDPEGTQEYSRGASMEARG